MPRAWDIRPPRKSKLTKQEKKRRKRSNIYFIFFLVLIAVFFIVFFGFDRLSTPGSPTTPSSEPTKTNSPEPSTSAALKTQNQVSIKLLNGTGRFEETQTVQKKLTDSGFKLSTTENALNLYDSTIIYFQSPYENYAKELATLLASYTPKTQKFSQATPYDIVIVIGTKQ